MEDKNLAESIPVLNLLYKYIDKYPVLLVLIPITFVAASVIVLHFMSAGPTNRLYGEIKDGTTGADIQCTTFTTISESGATGVARDCLTTPYLIALHPVGTWRVIVTADGYENCDDPTPMDELGPNDQNTWFTITEGELVQKNINMAALCLPPAHIEGDTDTTRYRLIKDAYEAGSGGETIRLRDMTFDEDLILDDPIAVTMAGGYDCDHSTSTGTTSIKGDMSINKGTVTIKNTIRLQSN